MVIITFSQALSLSNCSYPLHHPMGHTAAKELYLYHNPLGDLGAQAIRRFFRVAKGKLFEGNVGC